MQIKHWQQSSKPQQKSAKTPKKHRQWLAAHKVLVEKLRRGIGESHIALPFFLT